ncbi:hypothetical protein DCAR_0417311 [Daucus carota subsp. sativus]|uniref:RING-type domain-containing protein n=1 Tax=Daucus carota subsp. sativus TaxID=79200 RepID=A0AAF0WXL6_DAUCS|nr:hypothetical protein DCAR_0417311 [Daucus carota subsp. sativus]
MDLVEPQWRTNFSFSPPTPSRIWDCRLQTDTLLSRPGRLVHGTSKYSNSKERKDVFGSGRHTNHQHSVSDGILSYPGSQPDGQAPRWTSPVQKLNLEGFSTPSRKGKMKLSLSKSPNRQLFTNTCSTSRLTPDSDMIVPSNWSSVSTRIDQEFQTLSQLQEMDTSPAPSSISRREGYRWSTSSSYDMEYEAEQIDISENMDVDSLRSPGYQMDDTKCGICVKFLRQKSPWGSNRIMRSGDLPVAGILPCSHVFHAECLEQVSTKSEIHDPPCPLCLGLSEDLSSFSEPLMMALRSVRRRGVTISDTPETSGINDVLNYLKDSDRALKPTSSARSQTTSSKSFRKHFSSKGKLAKNFFRAKVFRRT